MCTENNENFRKHNFRMQTLKNLESAYMISATTKIIQSTWASVQKKDKLS